MSFSSYSLLYNLPRSNELLAFYRKKEIYYLYDNPYGFLESNPLKEAFRAIHKWYDTLVGKDNKNPDKEGAKEWMTHVYPVLLNLFNKATQGQRHILRNLLFSEGWVESRYNDIRRVSHALLARSYILDGRVLDLPSERYGVILMDAGLRDYNWSAYYESAYRLIQQLLTLSPLRIYHMGSKHLHKALGGNDNSPLVGRELRPRRTHPRLIMPYFEEVFTDPDKVHFVLVLSPISHIQADAENGIQADILDLADVLEMASANSNEIDPKLQKILISSMYTDAEKELARQQIASSQNNSTWAWKQKLFLVSHLKEQVRQEMNQELIQKQVADGQKRHLQNDVEEFLTIIGVNDPTFAQDLEVLESPLALQIASTLHQLSATDWERDLQSIWAGDAAKFDVLSDFNLQDSDSVRKQALKWIPQLGDVTKAQHPRDISMTIIWMILGLSRFNFVAAIAIVQEFLDLSLPETMQTDELKDLTEIMAVACTKTLFNFYRLSPDLYSNVEEYRHLLDLLPAFLRSKQGQQSSEFWQVFSILLLWARSDEWSSAFLQDGSDSPLAKAVRLIKGRQEISDLRRLLSFHESVVSLSRFYKQTELYWSDFQRILLSIADWYQRVPLAERPAKLSQFTRDFNNPRINENFVLGLLELISQVQSEISPYYGTKIGFGNFVKRIESHVASLGVQALTELESYESNVRQIANLMRLQLYGGSSRFEPMPAPPEGKRYGVILFNSSRRGHKSDIRSKVIGFIKHFRQLASEKQCEKIAFTIHRIGRNQHIYNDAKQLPSQQTLRLPDGTPDFVPLMSPILERYKPEQVAFALIISDVPPTDLDDWRDDEVWLDRIFLHSRGERSWMREFYGETNSVRNRRLKMEIEQLTEFILEFIEC